MAIIDKFLADLGRFLEKANKHRDKVLFIFIRRAWPRFITPNHLTFVRIIIGLFLCLYLFYFKNDGAALILSLFFIGIFTDLLDGSVARCLNKETKVGAIMDPIADRIIIVPIAVYSLFSDHKWLLLLLLLLEVISGLISAYAQGKNAFIHPDIFGKFKMFFQSLVFLAILYFWPNAPHAFFIYLLWLSVGLMIISIYLKSLEIKQFIFKKHA